MNWYSTSHDSSQSPLQCGNSAALLSCVYEQTSLHQRSAPSFKEYHHHCLEDATAAAFFWRRK